MKEIIYKKVEEAAKNTKILSFSKPPNFSFSAGQFGHFTLDCYINDKVEKVTRSFSLLSAPNDPLLSIAVRLTNVTPYSQALNSLKIEQTVGFCGPQGNMVINDDTTTPIVFIAGGIGIAPIYSMLRNMQIANQLSQSIHLFYGNDTIHNALFIDELFNLTKRITHFKFIPSLSFPSSSWAGETGFITIEMIKKYISHLSIPTYYLCGPNIMTDTLKQSLIKIGVPARQIITDERM